MDESAMCRERPSTSQRAIVACLITLALPVLLAYITVRPAMPRHLLRQMTPGMSKAEVRHLLGEPQDAEGEYQWEYSRWGNAGYVQVVFGQDEAVKYVNDESVFP